MNPELLFKKIAFIKKERDDTKKRLVILENSTSSNVEIYATLIKIDTLKNVIKMLEQGQDEEPQPQQDDPHAELKVQYAQDVETCRDIEGLEAWYLWQWGFNEKWQDFIGCKPCFSENTNYRRHSHANLIIQYHKGSERDKQRWQYAYKDTWLDCDGEPCWYENHKYRLKPDTITIDGKEYVAPLREPPAIGTNYWKICFADNKTPRYEWHNQNYENEWLKNRTCFATEEDARAVLNALQAILKGENHE